MTQGKQEDNQLNGIHILCIQHQLSLLILHQCSDSVDTFLDSLWRRSPLWPTTSAFSLASSVLCICGPVWAAWCFWAWVNRLIAEGTLTGPAVCPPINVAGLDALPSAKIFRSFFIQRVHCPYWPPASSKEQGPGLPSFLSALWMALSSTFHVNVFELFMLFQYFAIPYKFLNQFISTTFSGLWLGRSAEEN